MPDTQDKRPESKAGPEAYLSSDERKALQRSLSFPEDLPPKFKSWLIDFIAVNIPQIPVGQVVGFERFAGTQVSFFSNLVSGDTTTSSTTYVDLSGPSLSALEGGEYILMYGCRMQTNNTLVHYYSPSVNGAAASDVDAAQGRGPIIASVARVKIATLPAGTANTVAMRYRVDTSTGGFGDRWLVAVRVGNTT